MSRLTEHESDVVSREEAADAMLHDIDGDQNSAGLLKYLVEHAEAAANRRQEGAEPPLVLLHGPGGCGKSYLIRALTHLLRELEVGVMLAAPNGCQHWRVCTPL
eukprot:1304381-Amphidinium_carterae.1